MGASTHVGRVGGLAVALGVGAAVAGWGSGTAWADDDAVSSGPASESSTSVTGEASTDNGADSGNDPDPDGEEHPDADIDTDTEGETAAQPGAGGDPADTRAAGKRNGERARNATTRKRDAAQVDSVQARSAAAESDVDRTEPSATPAESVASPDVVVEPEFDAGLDVSPEPGKPDVAGVAGAIDNAVGKVSAAFTALFDPLVSPTPDVPAAAPQMWSLLAFARREFDAKPSTANPATAPGPEFATSEDVVPAAAKVAGAQASSIQAAAAVQNALTYTAPPTLFDRITVVALRVLQVVGSVFGVDIYGNIGKLIASASPPFFVKYGLDVQRTEFEVAPGNIWKVWEFTPPEPTGKTVVAVHGGGFILEPILTHWIDYADMARRTGATVVVPMYPLATTEKGSAVNVIPGLADYLSDQIARRGAENVSIYADSAGPVAALAAVRELILRGEPVPASMVLISFTPDATLSNPDIFTVDDPIIDPENLDFYATVNHWGDGLEPADPRLSALFVESEVFQQLPPTTIYVGDLEFIYPDNLLYHQRAVAEGVPISLVVGRGQYHDWPVGGLPINSQAPKVRKDIFRQLGLI